ncbi:LysR family transcriptional regulator [Psychromonas marina]|uniref:LysR family transcriptional regulator n=1 Tax=Psychromonas marina TaxID=88364 RepID=A0ABQ6DZK6_9GAMM|nr:LysR substrate-binding domain-containing protein [Psychromonas marina]GLS90482.1 LysR family transcriptional regulator [Psychromonas marina]
MRKQAPLKSIYSFIAVVETGSMSAAAKLLSVSHSAVSQSIKALEGQLGTELFERIGRNIELNREGKQYYKEVGPALHKIMQASEALLNKNNHHRLTVNMVNSLALHWWIPRVGHLQAFDPKLDVRISNRTGVFDLAREGVDVALIHDAIDDWQNYYCEKLTDDELVLVCGPGLLPKDSKLSLQEIITRYPAVSVANDRRKKDWRTWCEAQNLSLPHSSNNLTFNVSAQAIHATIRNFGVLITHRQFVKDDIEHGLLREIGSSVSNPLQAFYFVCRPEKLKLESVMSLRSWLREEFTSSKANNESL